MRPIQPLIKAPMSIGIVIATTEFVLLVADGRHSNAYVALADNVEKIVPIRDSLSVIEFGVAMGSQAVVQNLKSAADLPNDGDQVIGVISDSVHAVGAAVVNAVIPGSGDMSTIKVGVLAAGIDDEGTYVGGALFGHGMNAPSRDFIRPSSDAPRFICLGGEQLNASGYFAELASRAMRVSGSDSYGLLSMLQRAAKKTVTFAASLDQTIGGQVTYQVLSKGHPPHSGLI